MSGECVVCSKDVKKGLFKEKSYWYKYLEKSFKYILADFVEKLLVKNASEIILFQSLRHFKERRSARIV